MAEHKWFLRLSGQVATDINNNYMPALVALLQELSIQGSDVAVVQTAMSEVPNPITPDVYLTRTPYQSREFVINQFEGACERGYLQKVADDAYLLTDQGEAVAEKIPITAVNVAATIHPFPENEAEQLTNLLRKLVESSLSATELSHPALERSRFYDPGPDAPPIEKIRRYLNDLNAFRDDAHMAAWQTYDIEGLEWEAFSHVHADYVFGDAVATGVELAEKLSGFRGYDAEAYDLALRKVAERGWLQEENGRYTVTKEGKQVRDAVETETDRLFFGPWHLTPDEEEALKTLLEKCHEAFKPLEPKVVWEALDEARQAVAQHYWPALQKKVEESGMESWDLMLIRRAMQLEEGVSIDYLLQWLPYSKPKRIEEQINGAVKRGFIVEAAEGHYLATENGRAAASAVINPLVKILTDLDPLSTEKLRRTAELLQKLSDGIASAPTPAEKPAVADSRQFELDGNEPILEQINRYLMDVIKFRDDAHMAAWKKYDIPGYEWEAFSHIWGENTWGDPVSTTKQVSEKLAYRGYSEREYEAALRDCCQRGLLVKHGDSYQLTEKGKELRQEAEEETDNIFFAPWNALFVPELKELNELLNEMRTKLQASKD